MSLAIARPARRSQGIDGTADAWIGVLLVLPIVVTMVGLVFYPVIQTLWDSLHRINPMQAGQPFIGLAHYQAMLSDANVNQAWMNTFLYAGICVSLETVFGIAVALLINQLGKGRRWVLAAVILPWALPGVVNAVVWGWIYNPSFGLLNGLLTTAGFDFNKHVWFNDRPMALLLISLVHVWRMMPLTVVIILAALQSIPSDLYEAAKIDGANKRGMFRHITLPLIGGAIAIAMTQSTVAAFNFFDEAWILAGNSRGTRPILVQIYTETFQNLHFSYGMALSVVVMFVSLAVSLLYVVRVRRPTRFEA
jgi:multiple sugar transport system permease protein